jgi:predicted amidohydrolase
VGDLDANRALILAAVAGAVAGGADLLVLPELATSGYVFADAAEARAVALPPDHPFFDEVAAALAGTPAVVVFGFCEDAGEVLHNSAALVAATGTLDVYRKTHLWDREKLVFTPGADPPRVLDTPLGRLGTLICYDLEFPEMPRLLGLAGADVIAVPTNWPAGEHPASERADEVINAQVAARANGVYIACCDRRGTERGQAWNEATTIVDRRGWVLADSGPRSPVASADVVVALARDKANSPRNDLLADRRPDIYPG